MINPIKAKHLKKAGASCNEVERFARVFPKGARVTKANCLKVTREGFDLDWFSKHFLTAPAREVYDKAEAPAWEAYGKAEAQASEAYEKATAQALWEAICLEEAENVKSSRQ
uniref:Uncharacterized protein n=1 Tax=viral metagenome TaxID=1070528 RepID=A0A6M3Y2J5_9ZZZZ